MFCFVPVYLSALGSSIPARASQSRPPEAESIGMDPSTWKSRVEMCASTAFFGSRAWVGSLLSQVNSTLCSPGGDYLPHCAVSFVTVDETPLPFCRGRRPWALVISSVAWFGSDQPRLAAVWRQKIDRLHASAVHGSGAHRLWDPDLFRRSGSYAVGSGCGCFVFSASRRRPLGVGAGPRAC